MGTFTTILFKFRYLRIVLILSRCLLLFLKLLKLAHLVPSQPSSETRISSRRPRRCCQKTGRRRGLQRGIHVERVAYPSVQAVLLVHAPP